MFAKNQYQNISSEKQFDRLKIVDPQGTNQKQSKYYSNDQQFTVRKRLIDQYSHDKNINNKNDEVGFSTNHTKTENNGCLLNSLHSAIDTYNHSFKQPLTLKKPKYTQFQLKYNHVQQPSYLLRAQVLQEKEITKKMQAEKLVSIAQQQLQESSRFNRIDREITALYKQDRNINLEYRRQKFMQIFAGQIPSKSRIY